MQKSFYVEFKVVDGRDQIETQGKPLSSITILLTQDTKHLHFAKNMLNQNSFTSQAAVPPLFLDCQRMVFGFFERWLAVFMQLRQSLIASIGQNSNVLRDFAPVILEKLEVMFAPIAKGRGDNLSRLLVSNQLRFLSVSPLFTAVMPILAFFGCSIGC